MKEALVAEKQDVVLKNFLNGALKEIMSICEAQGASLFLIDAKSKELVLDAFYNRKKLDILGTRQRMGEGVSGKVIEFRQPILVKDIEKDSRFKRNGFTHYHTNSFISIPFLSSRGPIGLINLVDKSDGQAFTDKDFNCAVTMSKYFSTIIEDILLLAKMKEEWEVSHKQKASLEKYASVGKLAARVVHEINNPLDGIIRYTNMLLNHTTEHSVTKEYLIKIKNGLNRIANITRSLLDFSYQLNSNSSRKRRYSEVQVLIEDALEVLKGKRNGKIDIEKKYAEVLPRVVDMNLGYVFVNIIRNALEAMPAGGKLEISGGMRNSMLEVMIKDSGPGIAKEVMEHIFEPFFSTKSKEVGTGLGLSICKEVIDKYKGRIEVTSFPQEGSKFTILIPKRHLEND
ncbi:MAG: hypothetical protein DRP74_01985 [Candidatus Omnitrophota bacterium]|nr:MAG: hypothetical protein DRP74_01985 [Candidatus Omnitrophota bacterium]